MILACLQESVMKNGRTEQLELELEKKDAEIQQLKNIITQWEVCSLKSFEVVNKI